MNERCRVCLGMVSDDGREIRVGGELVALKGDEVSADFPPACMEVDPDSGQLVVKSGCLAQERIGA